MPGRDELIVRLDRKYRISLLALVCAGPLLAGCAGVGGEMFQTDLLSKDADWFSKPGRVFIKNVSIETPPLTPDKPVTAAGNVETGNGQTRETFFTRGIRRMIHKIERL